MTCVMRIFAVDPGTRHLGWAVFDTSKESYDAFGVFDLQAGMPKTMKTKYAHLVHNFCVQKRDLIMSCDVVAVEIQMQAKMKVVATALQCFFWDKHKMVAPLAVRKFFKISHANYRMNKKASIAFAQELVHGAQKKLLNAHKKRDDIADALILAKYVASVASNPTPARKRRRTLKK